MTCPFSIDQLDSNPAEPSPECRQFIEKLKAASVNKDRQRQLEARRQARHEREQFLEFNGQQIMEKRIEILSRWNQLLQDNILEPKCLDRILAQLKQTYREDFVMLHPTEHEPLAKCLHLLVPLVNNSDANRQSIDWLLEYNQKSAEQTVSSYFTAIDCVETTRNSLRLCACRMTIWQSQC